MSSSSPSFKEKDRDLVTWYEKQMADLQIPVHFHTEIKDIHSLKADEYIIATGSKARRFKLPGLEKSVVACEYLAHSKEVGKNVIVVGGGLSGCEIAYDLFLQGKAVSIVEMKNDLIAQKGVCMANSTYLREYFAWKKVPVYLETKVKAIEDDGIIATDKTGKDFKIAGDSVIMSVGYLPTPLAPEEKHVHLVGDCVHIGNLRSVIWGAYGVAMAI